MTDSLHRPFGSTWSSDASKPKLELHGIYFAYGKAQAVSGVDLSVQGGEFVSILGPSGCGKTTLLRIIAGLRRPNQGRVILDGTDITGLPPEKRRLGMVFQDLALFPHLSVSDNVGFSLAVDRRPRTEINRRTSEALALVGLSGYEDRSVNQLSGGQRQRVALARSIVAEPELLLLDEPLGALDAAIRRDMQMELKALQRSLGITFIFVTHDQDEAMSMSDRVVLMHDGHVVQDAPPYELYTNPASPFVAGFIGETNLVSATVVEGATSGSPVRINLKGREFSVLDSGKRAMRAGDQIHLSIRPEYIRIVETEGGGNCVPGRVVTQRFLGAEVILDVETEIGNLRVRERSRSELAAELTGTPVQLEIALDEVRIFMASGE